MTAHEAGAKSVVGAMTAREVRLAVTQIQDAIVQTCSMGQFTVFVEPHDDWKTQGRIDAVLRAWGFLVELTDNGKVMVSW